MKMHMRFVRLMTMAAAMAGFALATLPAQAQYEASWDKIQRMKKIQTGCIVQLPYWQRDAAGNWRGWGIEAAKDMAKELEVGWECAETTWGTAALAIQSGKLDFLFAMQATPLRARAITFAGPLYNHGFMTVNGKNFKGRVWQDYNKPGVKLASQAGSSENLVARLQAPQATHLAFEQSSEVSLAVVAGRADAMVFTMINGVVAKARNPDLGDFVVPTPFISLPAYVGIRNETDRRFETFVHWWAEWNRLRGQVEIWIKNGFVEMGVPKDQIPDKLYF